MHCFCVVVPYAPEIVPRHSREREGKHTAGVPGAWVGDTRCDYFNEECVRVRVRQHMLLVAAPAYYCSSVDNELQTLNECAYVMVWYFDDRFFFSSKPWWPGVRRVPRPDHDMNVCKMRLCKSKFNNIVYSEFLWCWHITYSQLKARSYNNTVIIQIIHLILSLILTNCLRVCDHSTFSWLLVDLTSFTLAPLALTH